MAEFVDSTSVIDAGKQAVFLNNVLDFFGDSAGDVLTAIMHLGVAKVTLEKALEIDPVEVNYE